ncbi:MAG: serine/threonine protein kinase, partial [Thermoguttaceae bacterium]
MLDNSNSSETQPRDKTQFANSSEITLSAHDSSSSLDAATTTMVTSGFDNIASECLKKLGTESDESDFVQADLEKLAHIRHEHSEKQDESGAIPSDSAILSESAVLNETSNSDAGQLQGTHAERILKADPFYRMSRAKRNNNNANTEVNKGYVYGIHRIVRPHVKGGMGQVYIAYDQFLKREVALKELFRDSTQDETIVHRFIVEAEITAQLEHPGIVPIHSLGLDINGNPYYTMKLIHGKTLQEAIKQYFRNPSESELKRLVRRFVSVCQTMAYVHKRGVIHRDLKPANIMLSEQGESLIMDWGIAKTFSLERETGVSLSPGTDAPSGSSPGTAAPNLTIVGTVVGTPAYMSPEQASPDSSEVGPLSDIFSLGAILFYMLTGRNAYTGKSSQEILTKVITAAPPKPSDVAKNIPPGLEAICLKAMARQQQNRYQSASELVADLCNWLDGEPISAMKESLSERTWRFIRKHQQISLGLFLVIFLVFAAIAVSLLVVDRNIVRERISKENAEIVATHITEYEKQIESTRDLAREARLKSDEYKDELDKTTNEMLQT